MKDIKRFKVIVDYPKSIFIPNEILTLDYNNNGTMYHKRGMEIFDTMFFEHYKNIFKKCEWWEGLKASELPKYLLKVNKEISLKSNLVKVSSWEYESSSMYLSCWLCKIEGNESRYSASHFVPLTKDEYDNYKISE